MANTNPGTGPDPRVICKVCGRIMSAVTFTCNNPRCGKPPAPKRYTIADIRAANMAAGHHFFDRDTMQHHGETVKDYRVQHSDPRGNRGGGRVLLESQKSGKMYEFNPKTGEISPPLIAVCGVVQVRKDGAIGIFQDTEFTTWADIRGPLEDGARAALMAEAHRQGYEVNHVISVYRR